MFQRWSDRVGLEDLDSRRRACKSHGARSRHWHPPAWGEWQSLEGLKTAAKEVGKNISVTCWAAIRFENRKKYKNSAEVLWPAELPNDAPLAAYMALEARWPFEPRTAGGVLENKVFTGEAGRQLIERELLLAGVKIRAKCQDPKKSMRPLGFSAFGLGFGSTIVTYRNCPNNALHSRSGGVMQRQPRAQCTGIHCCPDRLMPNQMCWRTLTLIYEWQ